jgi:hypothetical protein
MIPLWVAILILVIVFANMIGLLSTITLEQFPYMYILRNENINIVGKILLAIILFPFLFPMQLLLYIYYFCYVFIMTIWYLIFWIFAKDRKKVYEEYKKKFEDIPDDLERRIKVIPGVIESGLFVGYNTEVIGLN